MTMSTCYTAIKDVFKGGDSGVQTPPPPLNFQTFLKSEGKDVERKKICGGGGGLPVNIFSGGSGVEIFFSRGGGGGVENFFGGRGVEKLFYGGIYGGGVRNFRRGGVEKFSAGG